MELYKWVEHDALKVMDEDLKVSFAHRLIDVMGDNPDI